jgi:RHS repeat-associated protein
MALEFGFLWCTAGASASNQKYFLTLDTRFLHLHNSVGHSCQDPANDLAWEAAGRYSGAAANSYSFGASRSEDGDIGLSFFRNRWYDARLGRFTQEDPLGYAGGENLYAYAGNNPASHTDPFGLIPCPPCGPDGGPDWGALAKQWLQDRATDLGRLVAKFNAAVNPMASVVGGLFGRDPATGEKVGLVGAAALVATGAAGIADGPAIDITAGRAALSQLMQGEFKVIAGAGVAKEFRAAKYLGGNAADWAYVTSKQVWEHGGYRYQAHWAINTVTGETALAKLTAPWIR